VDVDVDVVGVVVDLLEVDVGAVEVGATVVDVAPEVEVEAAFDIVDEVAETEEVVENKDVEVGLRVHSEATGIKDMPTSVQKWSSC